LANSSVNAQAKLITVLVVRCPLWCLKLRLKRGASPLILTSTPLQNLTWKPKGTGSIQLQQRVGPHAKLRGLRTYHPMSLRCLKCMNSMLVKRLWIKIATTICMFSERLLAFRLMKEKLKQKLRQQLKLQLRRKQQRALPNHPPQSTRTRAESLLYGREVHRPDLLALSIRTFTKKRPQNPTDHPLPLVLLLLRLAPCGISKSNCGHILREETSERSPSFGRSSTRTQSPLHLQWLHKWKQLQRKLLKNLWSQS